MKLFTDPREMEEEDEINLTDDSIATEPCTSEEENCSDANPFFDKYDLEKDVEKMEDENADGIVLYLKPQNSDETELNVDKRDTFKNNGIVPPLKDNVASNLFSVRNRNSSNYNSTMAPFFPIADLNMSNADNQNTSNYNGTGAPFFPIADSNMINTGNQDTSNSTLPTATEIERWLQLPEDDFNLLFSHAPIINQEEFFTQFLEYLQENDIDMLD